MIIIPLIDKKQIYFLNESSAVIYDSHGIYTFLSPKDEYDTFFELIVYILVNVLFGSFLGFTLG